MHFKYYVFDNRNKLISDKILKLWLGLENDFLEGTCVMKFKKRWIFYGQEFCFDEGFKDTGNDFILFLLYF